MLDRPRLSDFLQDAEVIAARRSVGLPKCFDVVYVARIVPIPGTRKYRVEPEDDLDRMVISDHKGLVKRVLQSHSLAAARRLRSNINRLAKEYNQVEQLEDTQ